MNAPVPELLTPANGATLTDRTPGYTWDETSGAIWYQLKVTENGGSDVILTWYQVGVDVTCSAGTCSLNPNIVLPNAVYDWRVQPYTTESGNWYGAFTFTVYWGADDDGDGLPNDWEINGYDANNDGVIDIDLPALGANYQHKDIFVEMDYMVRADAANGLGPNQTVLDGIVASFAAAPVSNPDGVDGITIHLDLDQQVPLDQDLNNVYTEFYSLKNTYFSTQRAAIYHYMIWADGYNGGSSSGLSFGIPASDFIVTLGKWGTDNAGGTDEQKIGTFIHELGHNLGLTHGGNDHVHYKPNYISVMNYRFQTWGVYRNGSWGNFDYQRFDLPSLNETSLNETLGLNASGVLADYGTVHTCPNGSWEYDWVASGAIDWNCDGDTTDIGISVDVNYDGSQNTLGSQDNWANIIYNGGGVIGSGKSSDLLFEFVQENYVDPKLEELTYEQQLEIDQANAEAFVK
jgi:hypothetical protein